jgi:hypothetical protein
MYDMDTKIHSMDQTKSIEISKEFERNACIVILICSKKLQILFI